MIIIHLVNDFLGRLLGPVVKRGLRFPGRVEIVRSRFRPYQSPTGRKVKEREMLRVEQTYRDYKFFGVRAKDDITDTP